MNETRVNSVDSCLHCGQAIQKDTNIKSSLKMTYLLCILFGWMGLHRYFLGLYLTAILYSCAAVFSVGFFLFGLFQAAGPLAAGTTLFLLFFSVLFDLLILPLLVRQQRDLKSGKAGPADIAPWAKDENKSWWGRLQVVLRFAILLFVPGITIFIAISLGQYVIVAMVLLLLAFSLLVGSIGKGLYATEEIASFTQRIPFLPLTIATVKRFHDHYFQHQTKSVFFYLLYPVTGPIFFLFSQSARSEFRAFLSLFFLVVIAVLIQNFATFLSVFSPSDMGGIEFGLWACFYIATAGVCLFFLCVVPMISSTFYFSMTGRGFSLRAGAAVALIIAGISVLLANATSTVTFRGSVTAMGKMNHPDFRTGDFDWMNRAFLQNEIVNRHQLEREWWSVTDQIKADINSVTSLEANSQSQAYFLASSTNEYRSYMSSKLRPEEAAAFKILAIKPPSDGTTSDDKSSAEAKEWLAILFVPDAIGFGGFMGEAVLLYVISPEHKKVYTRWDTLANDAPWLIEQTDSSGVSNGYFSLVDREDLHFRNELNLLTAFKLIDDVDRIPTFGPWKWKPNQPQEAE